MVTTPTSGLRERNAQERRALITRIARRLFAENDFEQVTTQQVSREAGIGVGTLFRYAATKGELLLMVFNEEFAEAFERARIAADDAATTEDAVWALAQAVMDFVAAHPRNSAMYQRELLFGGAGERHRDDGLALVAGWQGEVARRIAGGVGAAPHDERVVLASRTIFAALSLNVSDVRHDPRPLAQLRMQVDQVIAGVRAQMADGET